MTSSSESGSGGDVVVVDGGGRPFSSSRSHRWPASNGNAGPRARFPPPPPPLPGHPLFRHFPLHAQFPPTPQRPLLVRPQNNPRGEVFAVPPAFGARNLSSPIGAVEFLQLHHQQSMHQHYLHHQLKFNSKNGSTSSSSENNNKGADDVNSLGNVAPPFTIVRQASAPNEQQGSSSIEKVDNDGAAPACVGKPSECYNYSSPNAAKQKTPMCKVAELARYNRLKHEYNLIDESGPAHQKVFTVHLVLKEGEVYEGKGRSIKRAQQDAADKAWSQTKLQKPAQKHCLNGVGRQHRGPIDRITPVVELTAIARERGLEPRFVSMDPVPFNHFNFLSSNCADFFPHAANHNNNFIMPPMSRMPNGMMPRLNNVKVQPKLELVSLKLGERHPEFTGRAPTKWQARNHAAVQALLYLGTTIGAKRESVNETRTPDDDVQDVPSLDPACADEPSTSAAVFEKDDSAENENDSTSPIKSRKKKSTISEMHENALRRRMDIKFELLDEKGPSHDKKYAIRCTVSNNECTIVLDAEGNSKRRAKQTVCGMVLDALNKLGPPPLSTAPTAPKAVKTTNKPAKRITIVKDRKSDPDYGQQVNPVSRLIQIQHAKNQVEPQFELISEHGQSRYKEFVYQVTVNEHTCQGAGPNKKLAKRAAAEQMLDTLGYSKPLPPPGKSLLKRRSDLGVGDGAGGASVERPTTTPLFPSPSVTLNGDDTCSEPVALLSTAPPQCSEEEREQGNQQQVEQQQPAESSPKQLSGQSSLDDGGEELTAVVRQRKVTFSNQVHTCPAPESRDLKKPLTERQQKMVADMARNFLEGKDGDCEPCQPENNFPTLEIGVFQLPGTETQETASNCTDVKSTDSTHSDDEQPPFEVVDQLEDRKPQFVAANASSREKLEYLAGLCKFSVGFTDLPKTTRPDGDWCFSLVTLGVTPPQVCNGEGRTDKEARENASLNALRALADRKHASSEPVKKRND